MAHVIKELLHESHRQPCILTQDKLRFEHVMCNKTDISVLVK